MYQDEPGDEFDVWLRSEQLPWSSFPRDLRLLAFQALPAFLQCIANKARELVRGVEVTSRQAAEILQVLEADPGKTAVNARTEELLV